VHGGAFFFGSSTVLGTDDFLEPGVEYGGFLVRAFNRIGMGFIPAALGGTAGIDATNGNLKYRVQLARYADFGVYAFETNDVTAGASLAQIQGYMASAAALLRAQGVSRVYCITINPFTTSTDNWATTTNQTCFYTGETAGKETVRQAVNAWLRSVSCLTIFDGVFDTAAAVEDGGATAPTGKWWANGTAFAATGAGLHPSSASHIRMAAVVTGYGLGDLTATAINPNATAQINIMAAGTISAIGGLVVPLSDNDAAAALLGIAIGGLYAVTSTGVVMRRAS
jgi:hypothetical protein